MSDTKIMGSLSMTTPLVVWCRACGTHHDLGEKCKPPVLTPSERIFGVEMEADLKGSVRAHVDAENTRIAANIKKEWAASMSRAAQALPNLPESKIDHPPHYTKHPSGVECIEITEHMSFCLGNAVTYLWRADEKGSPIEDLKKARWYIDREIKRRETATAVRGSK